MAAPISEIARVAIDLVSFEHEVRVADSQCYLGGSPQQVGLHIVARTGGTSCKRNAIAIGPLGGGMLNWPKGQ